jgi:hypothetical protein
VFGLTPCRLLALAVLETAVRDAHAGRLDARQFLEADPALTFWASLLGIQPDTVRRAAADAQWPERVAKAKAVLAASWLNRPASLARLGTRPVPHEASPAPPA